MKLSQIIAEQASLKGMQPGLWEKRIKDVEDIAGKISKTGKEYGSKTVEAGKETLGKVGKIAKTAHEWTPTEVKVGIPAIGAAAGLGAGLAAKKLRRKK
jgi:hypothetical protein